MAAEKNIDPSELLSDNREEGFFGVHRKAFTDATVFDLEQQKIFEGTWVFVGLASQLAQPNDFITLQVGRHPILVAANAQGVVQAFFNSCRHRGMIVQPLRSGNRPAHVCRYHGWAYDSSGRNQWVSEVKDGKYPDCFHEQSHDLVPVARFDRYRDFLFLSLNPDVPDLETYLGESRLFLDLLSDQAAHGLEFVSGSAAYTFRANWKLQIENALDMYHFNHVHVSYVELLRRREASVALGGPPPSGANAGEQGTFSFGRGHAVMWRSRSRASESLLAKRHDAFRQRMSEAQLKWSDTGRNLTIFPNMQVVDNVTSMMLRVIRPVAVDFTEMRTYCLAPVGESDEDREARLRDYEDFFNPSGLATPDDNVIYEHSQSGFGAELAGTTFGYLRGMGDRGQSRDSMPGTDLGVANSDWIVGPRSLGDETCFHDAYREWARLLAS